MLQVIVFAKRDLPFTLLLPLLNRSQSLIFSLLLFLHLFHETIVDLRFERILKLGSLGDNLFFFFCQIVIQVLSSTRRSQNRHYRIGWCNEVVECITLSSILLLHHHSGLEVRTSGVPVIASFIEIRAVHFLTKMLA